MFSRSSRSLSRARVGGLIDAFDTSMEGYILRVDEGINKTTAEIKAWKASIIAKIAQRATSKDPAFSNCLGPNFDACMLPEERAGDEFIINEYDPFLRRWKTYASMNALFWNREEVDAFAQELTKKRTAFTVATGRTFKAELPTIPAGGDKGTADRVLDSVNNVVLIAGIGVAAYVGLTYVVPLLSGAASKSRASVRAYRES